MQVVNVSNGARFETYVIEGAAGSGQMCLNGAAARLGHPGDTVIVISYALMEDSQARVHSPKVVHVDGGNRLSSSLAFALQSRAQSGRRSSHRASAKRTCYHAAVE